MVSYQMRPVFFPEIAEWWKSRNKIPLCSHCKYFLGGKKRGKCRKINAVVPVEFAAVCLREESKDSNIRNVTVDNDACNHDTTSEGDSGRIEEAWDEGGDIRRNSEKVN